jgi:ABC-type phosphate transport system substrate-binding protein
MPYKDIIRDRNAVSTVVASLMLIMVVAGSAAFLSAMMRNMGTQTDSMANKSTSVERTAMKINIISSDLAEPAVAPLVDAYNNKQTGVFLQLQTSATISVSSTVAIGGVGTGTADIGVSDRLPSPDEMEKYPNLVTQKLGTSGIVVVVNSAPTSTFTTENLKYYYSTSPLPSPAPTPYQITGTSGTQEAFMQYLGNPTISPGISAVKDNPGMLAALKSNSNSIGFIEYGYVSSPGIGSLIIANLSDERNNQTYINIGYSNFTLAVANNSANNPYYPPELVHPLYFVTRGNPSLEDSFIKWARSFEGQDILEKNGYISYTRDY